MKTRASRFAASPLALAMVFALVGCSQPEPEPKVPGPPLPPPEPPAKAPRSETPDADFRKSAPAPGPAVVFQAPVAKELKLKSGVPVVFIPRSDLPVVNLRVVFRRGASSAKPAVASFASALWFLGTKKRSALEISDDFANQAAKFWAWAGHDSTQLHLKCLSEKFEASLAIFADSALRPSFPTKELKRIRAKRLTSLSQESHRPRALLGRALAKVLYKNDHPYGRLVRGGERDIKAVKRRDLQDYFRQHMAANQATIVVSGAITEDRLLAALNKEFGQWKSKAIGAKKVKPPRGFKQRPPVWLVDVPKSTQTHIAVADYGLARKDKDFAATLLLNTVLGGQFSSRLNLNLREKHSLTYGARSGFAMRRYPAHFSAGAAVVADKTGKAISETLLEISRLAEKAPTDEELQGARQNLLKALPAQFETTGQVVSAFSNLAALELPSDEYARREQLLSGVSRQAVLAAGKRFLHPKRAAIVLVGDAKKVMPQLEVLKLGKIVVKKPEELLR